MAKTTLPMSEQHLFTAVRIPQGKMDEFEVVGPPPWGGTSSLNSRGQQ